MEIHKRNKNKQTKQTKKQTRKYTKHKNRTRKIHKNYKKLLGGYSMQQPILQLLQPFDMQKQISSIASQQFASARCTSQIAAYKINPRAGLTPECRKYMK